ncbi:AMMECR1 domain-containing protein [Lasiosphaeria miniovina]|uniref:AMMECR1 domain-containing protein n=1 Tax=Lasiosphaeria miniovina TaxID=1954250 RepID=A0AA40DTR3_9PEZI|nr:AMMECR1 domain-containing protein [Lasiosphaeria miniovina]KAK0713032.1 AMMECR1 domain-containing protein [Lasiosphaeria miniovina]
MSTVEHCLYCLEALAAHLEDRKPMTLDQVQMSWAEYISAANDADDDADELAKRLPALRRLAASSSSSSTAASASSSSSSSTTSLQQQSGVATPATSVSSTPPPTIAESPLFVTWNTLSGRGGEHSLRGCIGTFEPHELGEGLSSYALTSALQDTRFSPITLSELPSLEVAVTLLTNFEDAADPMDWELGKHGLRISFLYHGYRHGATYLPNVAPEQGWTKEETISSLMRKAGWTGRRDRWRDVNLKVVRYQGREESLEYEEYKRWRDWVVARQEDK